MFQIAKTPEPPYYAVIAPAVLAGDVTGYPEMAMHLMETTQRRMLANTSNLAFPG